MSSYPIRMLLNVLPLKYMMPLIPSTKIDPLDASTLGRAIAAGQWPREGFSGPNYNIKKNIILM